MGVTGNEILSSITYTSNYFIYINKAWPLSSLHFWSLAVEEQFYLAWPLIILFWPRKYLIPAMLFFIATGFISQLLITDYEFGYLPTNTCLDCFGTGGVLAFIVVYQPELLSKFYRWLTILCITGIVILIVCWQTNFYPTNTRFIHAVMSAWLINHILVYGKRRSAWNSLLSSKLLISIGKVSYGIYLYHILYICLANKLWYKYIYHYYAFFIDKEYEPWIFVLVNFTILYFISWLSWKFIEKPFLALKHKFKYR